MNRTKQWETSSGGFNSQYEFNQDYESIKRFMDKLPFPDQYDYLINLIATIRENNVRFINARDNYFDPKLSEIENVLRREEKLKEMRPLKARPFLIEMLESRLSSLKEQMSIAGINKSPNRKKNSNKTISKETSFRDFDRVTEIIKTYIRSAKSSLPNARIRAGKTLMEACKQKFKPFSGAETARFLEKIGVTDTVDIKSLKEYFKPSNLEGVMIDEELLAKIKDYV